MFSDVVISIAKVLSQELPFLTQLNKVFIYWIFIHFIYILPQRLNTTILHNKALAIVKSGGELHRKTRWLIEYELPHSKIK